MSYEEMSRQTETCKCGKGTITYIRLMDDWNRTKGHLEINCARCKAENVKIQKRLDREEAERVKAENRALALAKFRYLEKWINRFSGLKGKRAWEALPDSWDYPSLGTFYKHVKAHKGGLAGYIRWRFETDLNKIFPTVFQDEEIERLLKAAERPPTRGPM